MVYRIASDHLRGLVEEAYQFAGHLGNGIPHHDRDISTPPAVLTLTATLYDDVAADSRH